MVRIPAYKSFEEREGILVLPCRAVKEETIKSGEFDIQVYDVKTDLCPFCFQVHQHGWYKDDDADVRHRVEHCVVKPIGLLLHNGVTVNNDQGYYIKLTNGAGFSDEVAPKIGSHHPWRSGFVYLAKGGGEIYKIGCSKNPERRMYSLGRGVELIHSFHWEDMRLMESFLHWKFRSKRAHGEWFYLSEDEVRFIRCFENAGPQEWSEPNAEPVENPVEIITHADWLTERERLREEITDYILAGEEPPPSLWENLYRVAVYVERTRPDDPVPHANEIEWD